MCSKAFICIVYLGHHHGHQSKGVCHPICGRGYKDWQSTGPRQTSGDQSHIFKDTSLLKVSPPSCCRCQPAPSTLHAWRLVSGHFSITAHPKSLWHELQISLCKPSDVSYFVWIQKVVIRMWDPIYAFIKRFIVCFHKHLVNIIGNVSESSSSNTMRNIRLLVVTMLFAKIVHSRYVWFRWH